MWLDSLTMNRDQVCLWLGANVMLEYPRDEAILLLEDNLKNAKAALVTLVDDMGHLRDQITVTEVNMARVFNWDVKAPRHAYIHCIYTHAHVGTAGRAIRAGAGYVKIATQPRQQRVFPAEMR